MTLCDSCGMQMQNETKICPSCIHKHDKQIYTESVKNVPCDAWDISTDDVEHNKVPACCSYIPIMFLLPILVAPNSRYVRFHVNQSVILFALGNGVGVILGCLFFLQLSIPLILILATIFFINYVLVTILGIIGAINAFKGRVKELPVIGKIRIVKTIKPDDPGFWTV